MANIAILKKRSDFVLAAKSGLKSVRPSLIVQLYKRDMKSSEIRIGFTAAKMLGNAVVRNRIKRRLRSAAAALVPELGQSGCDYVFIGRQKAYSEPFGTLLNDMRYSLQYFAKQA